MIKLMRPATTSSKYIRIPLTQSRWYRQFVWIFLFDCIAYDGIEFVDR